MQKLDSLAPLTKVSKSYNNEQLQRHKNMETLTLIKIDLSAVRDSIYREIEKQLEEETSDFDKDIEVSQDGTTFFTKVKGEVIITPARFQGSHDCPPDPPHVDMCIESIAPIVYVDETNEDVVVDIDTEKLTKKLNRDLSY